MRSLSRKEGRNEFSLLLLEGTHLLQESLKTNSLPKEIIATSEWISSHPELFNSISNQISFIEVTEDVLKASLTTVNPDGVASLFSLSSLPLAPKEPKFILGLYNVQDPGNLGSLFRTALASDIDVMWLFSGVDPLNQKVLRSSAGAVLHLPYERFPDNKQNNIESLVEKLIYLDDENYQVIATAAPTSQSFAPKVPYWEIDWNEPTVLLLGNEGRGLHPEIQKCCTHLVTLPHSASVESLNVASAAVPLLLERRRAKMIKGIH